MIPQLLNKNIEIISEAIEEIVFDSPLYKYIKNTPIHFQANVHILYTKYLGRYDNDIVYDILMKMFTKVYIENWKSIVKNYNPEQPVFPYLYTIMKNEVISISISLTNRRTKYIRINPLEDGTIEDSWDRIMVGDELQFQDPICSSLSESEIEEFTTLIADYEKVKSRIIKKELFVADIESTVQKLDKKIDGIRTQMQSKQGYHRPKYIDTKERPLQEMSLSAEDMEEQANSDFVNNLKAKLKSIETKYRGHITRPWQSDRLKIVDLLMADFNLTECATFFEVSPTSTSKWSNQVKNALFELADDMEFNHGDDSLVLAVNSWIDDLESQDRINNSRNSGCPLVDKAQLYKQIISTFGVDFMYMED